MILRRPFFLLFDLTKKLFDKEIMQQKLKATMFHMCKIGSSCLSVICPNPNLGPRTSGVSVTCVNGAQTIKLSK